MQTGTSKVPVMGIGIDMNYSGLGARVGSVRSGEGAAKAGIKSGDVITKVNGKPVAAKVDPKRTLLRYLREDLRMVGTKDGCTSGDCGSCAVLVDGKRQDACTYLMRRADGVAIETIEGLASPEGKLHPIQAAYLETGGTQCGFCTPGMIMASADLLRRIPNPTEEQIRHELEGNLCRCTGYHNIVKAVQAAAGARNV